MLQTSKEKRSKVRLEDRVTLRLRNRQRPSEGAFDRVQPRVLVDFGMKVIVICLRVYVSVFAISSIAVCFNYSANY